MRITGGSARGRPIKVVRSRGLRPTSERVRGALFQVLGAAVEGAKVLDLYAGCGALGLEALSRGAEKAEFVEADARLCQVIRDNLAGMGFEASGRVRQARVEEALLFLEGRHDLILLDPPYEVPGVEAVLERIASSALLEDGGTLVVEHSARKGLAEQYGPVHLVQRRRYGDTAISLYKA